MLDIIMHPIFLWILFGLIISGLFMWALTYIIASYFVYIKTLSRVSKDSWSRDIPSSIDDESKKMYSIGLKWAEEHKAFKQDVHMINDGLNLYGEYYDLGKETCAVILSGRTESLKYGYYFAEAYCKKCNILVLDPRGHGLSDGRFNTVGFEESKDIAKWIEYMHDKYNVKSFVFHGICIGAAGGILALTLRNCKPYVKAIITEGMFANFGESMKNNLRVKKKPIFIFYQMINKWQKHFTGYSMDVGPINYIDKLNVPLLMLQSKEDLFSKVEYASKLYERAGSKEKQLVLFEKGAHSKVRINNTEKYDEVINNFLEKVL